MIERKNRIGDIDRKRRVVNENTDNGVDGLKWTTRAFQIVYGYEYQGDNLLIGRINLLMTFVDYLEDRWNREPSEKELKTIANIISWNLWPMDGLKGTVPIPPKEENIQLSLLDSFDEKDEQETVGIKWKIYYWRGDKSILFEKLKENLNYEI